MQMRLPAITDDPGYRHPLFFPISVLIGLLLFLRQILGTSSLEHGTLVALVSSVGVYLVLTVALVAFRKIAPNALDEEPEKTVGKPGAEPVAGNKSSGFNGPENPQSVPAAEGNEGMESTIDEEVLAGA